MTERLAGLRILVVDDNDDSLEVLCAILEGEAASVTCVPSATDAVAALETRHYDAVVSDLEMPGLDGFWLAEVARKSAGHAEVKLIALTAHAQPAVAEKSLAAGFDAFLTKPLNPEQLVETIAQSARES